MSYPRAWLDDHLIVTGGRQGGNNLADTEIYDPQTDRWHRARPMPHPQAGTASAVYNSSLYVFGGEIFNPTAAVFANVWRYDFQQDQWHALADLPTPRHGLGAGRIGQRIYVIGGATKPGGSGTSNRNELLNLGL